jgi:hypothetical protein
MILRSGEDIRTTSNANYKSRLCIFWYLALACRVNVICLHLSLKMTVSLLQVHKSIIHMSWIAAQYIPQLNAHIFPLVKSYSTHGNDAVRKGVRCCWRKCCMTRVFQRMFFFRSSLSGPRRVAAWYAWILREKLLIYSLHFSFSSSFDHSKTWLIILSCS